jgi:predicted nucleic acid-binding protein
MRVFLDANVLFSAAYRTENSMRDIFRLAEAGSCEIVASAFAVDEARRNIARKQPGKAGELESLVASIGICQEGSAEAVQWARTTGLPGKDAPILAAAVQARADFLVTGDRSDFGHLYGKKLRGTEVLPPSKAIERILAASR